MSWGTKIPQIDPRPTKGGGFPPGVPISPKNNQKGRPSAGPPGGTNDKPVPVRTKALFSRLGKDRPVWVRTDMRPYQNGDVHLGLTKTGM